MRFKILLVVIGVMLFSTTCRKDVYSPDVCFQENILPIFVSNCAMSGCHDGKHEKYDLSNYNGIMKGIRSKHPLLSEVYKQIRGSNPSMPPSSSSPLSQKDITMIKLWIEMGAQNSSNCFSCDTTSYTYNERISPIINTWCKGCHEGSNPGGGYDFTTYNGLVVAVTANRLMGSLNHQSGFVAMPGSGTTSLSTCDINAFQKWVNAGHPNN